jgi:2-polyprenyl-3-methyl-5-hydroxy-6-metoxy-1,4-benzoquinol methylase
MKANNIYNIEIKTEQVKLCPICNNDGVKLYERLCDIRFNAPGEWDISLCKSCTTLWVNPRPLKEELYKCYLEYPTHCDKDIDIEEKEQNVSKWERLKDIILSGRKKENQFSKRMFLTEESPGRLLDIGCGNGSYLALMRDNGWDVAGVEPDPKAALLAKERFGLDIFVGNIMEADFPPNSFDAITLSHVIEHVPNPHEVLTHCFFLLKHDGKLAITTPNVESLGRRIFGSAWFHLHPPQHLILYSPTSLRKIVEKVGFRILMLRSLVRTASGVFVGSGQIISEYCAINKRSRISSVFSQSTLIRAAYVFIEHWGNKILRDLGEEIGILAVK